MRKLTVHFNDSKFYIVFTSLLLAALGFYSCTENKDSKDIPLRNGSSPVQTQSEELLRSVPIKLFAYGEWDEYVKEVLDDNITDVNQYTFRGKNELEITAKFELDNLTLEGYYSFNEDRTLDYLSIFYSDKTRTEMDSIPFEIALIDYYKMNDILGKSKLNGLGYLYSSYFYDCQDLIKEELVDEIEVDERAVMNEIMKLMKEDYDEDEAIGYSLFRVYEAENCYILNELFAWDLKEGNEWGCGVSVVYCEE